MWEQIPGVASLKGILHLFVHESSATVDGFRNPAKYHQLTFEKCSIFHRLFIYKQVVFAPSNSYFIPSLRVGEGWVPPWQVDSPPSTEAQGSRWG